MTIKNIYLVAFDSELIAYGALDRAIDKACDELKRKGDERPREKLVDIFKTGVLNKGYCIVQGSVTVSKRKVY